MTILDAIVQSKRAELEHLPATRVTSDVLRAAVSRAGPRRDFDGALRRHRDARLGLIAEVKRASPSAGLICPDFDPAGIARAYTAAGADCISVLTDAKYFQGSLADLESVRAATPVPLLRKDFILDPRQLLQSIDAGADAVLLIVAILTDAELDALHRLATSAGLSTLVEVHNESELDRALGVGARLIGVNNRDLRTFTVDLDTTARLARRLASWARAGEILLISESGIRTRADAERLAASGAHAMLIGETLMRDRDLPAKVAELCQVPLPARARAPA